MRETAGEPRVQKRQAGQPEDFDAVQLFFTRGLAVRIAGDDDDLQPSACKLVREAGGVGFHAANAWMVEGCEQADAAAAVVRHRFSLLDRGDPKISNSAIPYQILPILRCGRMMRRGGMHYNSLRVAWALIRC